MCRIECHNHAVKLNSSKCMHGSVGSYRYFAGYSPYPLNILFNLVRLSDTPPTVLTSCFLVDKLVLMTGLEGAADEEGESLET